MKTSHPALWAAGFAGLALGTALVFGSIGGPSEVADLASGYGVMVIGSALYLLIGLKLRQRFGRHAQTPVAVARRSGTSSASARS